MATAALEELRAARGKSGGAWEAGVVVRGLASKLLWLPSDGTAAAPPPPPPPTTQGRSNSGEEGNRMG